MQMDGINILYTCIVFVALELIFAYNLKLIHVGELFLSNYYELILPACDNFLRSETNN